MHLTWRQRVCSPPVVTCTPRSQVVTSAWPLPACRYCTAPVTIITIENYSQSSFLNSLNSSPNFFKFCYPIFSVPHPIPSIPHPIPSIPHPIPSITHPMPSLFVHRYWPAYFRYVREWQQAGDLGGGGGGGKFIIEVGMGYRQVTLDRWTEFVEKLNRSKADHEWQYEVGKIKFSNLSSAALAVTYSLTQRTHAHTHLSVYTHTHIHIYTYTHTTTYIHTHTHIRTHARIHTTHTTCAHTQVISPYSTHSCKVNEM